MGAIRSFMINLVVLCVRAIVQSYTYLTLPLYYLVQNPKERLRRSRVIRSRQLDPSDPYSPYVRTGPVPDHPLTACKTVLECFDLMKKIHRMDRPVVGYRTIIDDQIVLDANGQPMRMDGKAVRKLRLTNYQWLTYEQVFDKCEVIAKGLAANGFVKHKRCAIFTETCVENLLFMIASQAIGLVGVGVFSNLGDEGESTKQLEHRNQARFDLDTMNVVKICGCINIEYLDQDQRKTKLRHTKSLPKLVNMFLKLFQNSFHHSCRTGQES